MGDGGQARGAKVFHIDPRFTRTSALADTYVPMRAGTDIAFLGGVINYILSNELDFREYVSRTPTRPSIVSEEFRRHRGPGRAVLRLRRGHRRPTTDQLAVRGRGRRPTGRGRHAEHAGADRGRAAARVARARRAAARRRRSADPTLQHPRCVYQILKRHFARYTPEMVERVCGMPQEQFLEVCEAWTANSGRERTTALVYSVGWTQHSVGVQYIRTGAIIQLLLGNMGRPGRRHHGAARARQHPGLHRHPDAVQPAARLPADAAPREHPTTRRARSTAIRSRAQKGFWGNADAYWCACSRSTGVTPPPPRTTSASSYLPRMTGDHGTYRRCMDMVDGKVNGYFLLGQNPAVGSAHGRLQRLGMANLDWLVVRDLAMIESATFWKDSPEIETGEIAPEECRTEVFFLPAASHVEKEGTFTQTQRMLQWREKAVEPPGDQRSELWFFYHLGRMVRERLAASTEPRDEPRAGPGLGLPREGPGREPSRAEDVLRGSTGTTWPPAGRSTASRAQGRRLHRLRLLDLLRRVRRRREPGRPPQARTGSRAGWHAEWGWAWPANRRILYNRASADPDGKPWSERKKLRLVGRGRRASGPATTCRTSRRPSRRRTGPEQRTPRAPEALRGDDPFIMQADGKGWLYAPSGVSTGRCPRTTSRTSRRCATRCTASRATRPQGLRARGQPVNPSPPRAGHSEVFPFVFTVGRLTEHHTAGGMSRQLPYLSELQPEMFVEVSPELAARAGLTHLGWATSSPAGRRSRRG